VSGNWIFAGIVSFGDGCARPGEPGAYTRLTHHLDWISQIMGKLISLKFVHLVQPDIFILFNLDNPDATPIKFPKTNCPGFTCQMGTGTCILKSYLCDDVVDCFGAEDETNCSISTTTRSDFMKMTNDLSPMT